MKKTITITPLKEKSLFAVYWFENDMQFIASYTDGEFITSHMPTHSTDYDAWQLREDDQTSLGVSVDGVAIDAEGNYYYPDEDFVVETLKGKVVKTVWYMEEMRIHTADGIELKHSDDIIDYLSI